MGHMKVLSNMLLLLLKAPQSLSADSMLCVGCGRPTSAATLDSLWRIPKPCYVHGMLSNSKVHVAACQMQVTASIKDARILPVPFHSSAGYQNRPVAIRTSSRLVMSHKKPHELLRVVQAVNDVLTKPGTIMRDTVLVQGDCNAAASAVRQQQRQQQRQQAGPLPGSNTKDSSPDNPWPR